MHRNRTVVGRVLALLAQEGRHEEASGMVNKTKPFNLIGRHGRNTIYLRYGESADDPRPFTLVVTPIYVAAKLNREDADHEDVIAYVETNADELRIIAISKYERGFSTETLL
jgi:hypothetical protein